MLSLDWWVSSSAFCRWKQGWFWVIDTWSRVYFCGRGFQCNWVWSSLVIFLWRPINPWPWWWGRGVQHIWCKYFEVIFSLWRSRDWGVNYGGYQSTTLGYCIGIWVQISFRLDLNLWVDWWKRPQEYRRSHLLLVLGQSLIWSPIVIQISQRMLGGRGWLFLGRQLHLRGQISWIL